MKQRAAGTFEVKLTPRAPAESGQDSFPRRYSLDKRFSGDLEASSVGEMLGAGTAVENSMGYVAIERVTGTLAGKPGSFILQHWGTMHRGAMTLTVSVLPDSGTEALTGLSGTMKIVIEGKNHSYDLEYTLPDSPGL